MRVLNKTWRCAVILVCSCTIVKVKAIIHRPKKIKGQPSVGNFILREEYSSEIKQSHRDDHNRAGAPLLFAVNSNVPVTVQRYRDDRFMDETQPLRNNEAKVLVTSDCDASSAYYVLDIKWSAVSVTVNVDNVQGGTSASEIIGGRMPLFLEPSSYNATWSYENPWCSAKMMDDGAYKEMNNKGRMTTTTDEPEMVLEESPACNDQSCSEEEVTAGHGDADQVILKEDGDDCHVNVEVMLDGCSHGLHVKAPAIRVLDATLENVESERSNANNDNGNDDCITNYEANIKFPGQPILEAERSLTVPGLDERHCMRAVMGRPFVDSTGRTLQALPVIEPLAVLAEDKVRVAADAEDDTYDQQVVTKSWCPSLADNSTNISQSQLQLLGEEWTNSAMGEHASVASFAAFSIALMTNGAPSELVEGALNAALDEARHAQISFEIASELLLLTGGKQEVRPGPLPRSEHVFGRDLEVLALAVAKEGCVDETLSALEAAAEVDRINAMLKNNDAVDNNATTKKYSAIDSETLAWIRDELRVIALEESGHAILAWGTFQWVCSVDSNACNSVKHDILNEAKLDRAFHRRFDSYTGGTEALKLLKDRWKEIYSSLYDFGAQGFCIYSDENSDDIDGESLVSVVARRVVRGIRCD